MVGAALGDALGYVEGDELGPRVVGVVLGEILGVADGEMLGPSDWLSSHTSISWMHRILAICEAE